MTLNITLASRWLMAQSSDFRLTRRAGPSTIVKVSESAQKQVVLQYHDWSGLLCYTGIAQWGSHHTAEWLVDVLTHEGGAQRTPGRVFEQLVVEGDKWLAGIPSEHRWHTFTLMAYEKGVPRVRVASTFERAGGPLLPAPAGALMVSQFRARGPRVLVTGQSAAVTEDQRERLRSSLAQNADAETVRHQVAEISREAATSAGGTVSEECVVSHLRPDGSGEAQVFGNLSASYVPALIQSGRNLKVQMPAVLQEASVTGPVQLVGATWANHGAVGQWGMLLVVRELTNQKGDGWPMDPRAKPLT